MSLTVNNNIAAMNSYRNLAITDSQMSKSLEKLSSGFRINRAADDAAGMAISEGLRSQIGGLKVAVRNTQDGISVVQTAEGALTETHSILQRMRDLSVQASNDGSLNLDAKKNIQSEIGQLKSELDRIANTTSFNGRKLLNGSYKSTFQVGANAGETISVGVTTNMGTQGLSLDQVDITDAVAAGAMTATAKAATATPTDSTVTTTAGNYSATGTGWSNLNGTVTLGGGTSVDLATVKASGGGTPDLADLQSTLDQAFGAGNVTASVDASNNLVLTGPKATTADTSTDSAAKSLTFTQQSGAEWAIGKIDTAIKTVSTTRADLGAIQNRFEHTVNNLNVAVENLSASESRIRDTDMAQEMTNFTRTQILTQAGTAMLAQANQAPQSILKLLG